MKKTTYILIAVVVVLILAAVGWYFLSQTKAAFAKAIIKAGKHHNLETLMSFDKDYLKEWTNAAKAEKDSFEYGDGTYATQGGRQIS